MDSRHRLDLANRIHLGLVRELGQGIDVKQMLSSTLYARDVLLVCRAYPGSDLQRLGEQFRQATAEAIERRAARPAGRQREGSGFGASRPPPSKPFSGFDELVEALPHVRQRARRWLTPSTWFTR